MKKSRKIHRTLLHKVTIDPLFGGLSYQGRELAFKLGLSGTQNKQFTDIFMGLSRLFLEKDLSLVEVNPLVLTKQGNLVCLTLKYLLMITLYFVIKIS